MITEKVKSVRKSENRLDVEGFNNLEGAATVERRLLDVFDVSADAFSYVDIERPYWQNASDTLVIAVDEEEVWRFGAAHSMSVAVGLAEFIADANCDEFNSTKIGGKRIMRFWWD